MLKCELERELKIGLITGKLKCKSDILREREQNDHLS